MKIDLTEKRILITGASKGIGLAIAKQLAESGATVIAHYNSTSQSIKALEEKYPDKIISIQIDLNETNTLVKEFNGLLDRVKQIDGVVLNAGIAIESNLEKDTQQWIGDWNKTMNINMHSPAVLTRLLLDHFKKRGGGRLVFITSRAAFRGDTTDYLAYGASKAGMLNIMKTIARGMGEDNIKAFGVAPGFVHTEMAQKFIDTYGEEFVLSGNALKELTQPDDIAPMVAFLLSGKADHATGATFDINAASYVR